MVWEPHELYHFDVDQVEESRVVTKGKTDGNPEVLSQFCENLQCGAPVKRQLSWCK